MDTDQLVVGAGSVGSALATHLAETGRPVTLATRSGSGPEHPLINRVAADATSVDSLLSVAPHATVIYNCANPVRYDKWAVEWPPMAQAFLAFAERTGAVLVTCSNLYAYGQQPIPLREDMSLDATWTNGRVRAKMWLDAKALHDAGRIRTTEVRGADYVAPGMQSRVGDRVVPRLKAGKGVRLLNALDQPHSWTAPVDVARLMAVVGSDDRAWGRPWHVPSNPPRTQRQLVDDVATALGASPATVAKYPDAVVWGLALVNPMIRELTKTAYQFNAPFVIDDSAARTTFAMAPTPWDEILLSLVRAYE